MASIWVEAEPDNPGIRDTVEQALRSAGVEQAPTPDATLAVLLFERASPEVTIRLRELAVERRVVAVAIEREALAGGAAWRLLESGASDVLELRSPSALAELLAARAQRLDTVDRLIDSPAVQRNLVGVSRAWTGVLRRVIEIAAFGDAPLLIMGESGTGKELLARLVHMLDPRPSKGELVILDCTTIVPELSGSELFGHERGSFTGSIGARDGAFALADGGTLFLDEVGELQPPLQAQLLRVLQEHTYKRVGGNTWHRSSFRLVAATNRELSLEIEERRFRRDLFHRMSTWVVTTPPLRERREDVVPLARHFLAELRPGEAIDFDGPVRDFLSRRDYPGNVRELKQLVTRMAGRHVGPGNITVGDIPAEELTPSLLTPDFHDRALEHAIRGVLTAGAGLREITRAAGDIAIRLAIADERGNLQRAARRLGVTDRALQLRRARPER